MYNKDYGYRSGINRTMRNHLKNTILEAKKIVKLNRNDLVLDIASNDATLLNYYNKNLIRVNRIGLKLNKYLNTAKKNNKIIHGYGASTKGNVLLQFFKLKKYFDFISDRNPAKFGLRTPGTNIEIISEKVSRSKKPDIYFVLTWHFKNEILKREKSIRQKGTKFVFFFTLSRNNLI